jgi:hypothetical protein
MCTDTVVIPIWGGSDYTTNSFGNQSLIRVLRIRMGGSVCYMGYGFLSVSIAAYLRQHGGKTADELKAEWK